MNARTLTAALRVAAMSTACANVRYFRGALEVRTFPPQRYTLEVPGNAAHGNVARVTTDRKGRVMRVARHVDGQTAHETTYEYSGDGPLPHTERDYSQGVLTRVIKIVRDASGQPTRLESYTAQGELTGYVEASWNADSVLRTNYTPAGVPRWRWTTYYSPQGVRVRSVYTVEGNTTYTEHVWDDKTGLETSSKVFDIDGRLQNSRANTYDDDNQLLRTEIYSPAGVRYGVETYEHELLVKKSYNFPSGHTEETALTYNAAGRADRAQFYRDNKLICTFVYEYLSDGTIKRTIAQGPDGSLWAEYANRFTDIVDKDGYPPNSTVGAIYHRDAWF